VTVRRVVSMVLALGVVAAACVWVSAVRFNDRFVDCGVPLGAAIHGREASRLFVAPTAAEKKLLASGKGFSERVTNDLPFFVTVCATMARERVAIAGAAIIIAVAGAVLVNRRRMWGRPPPVLAV
jgi:hypothetical protein